MFNVLPTLLLHEDHPGRAQYAATHGVSDADVLKVGMEEKSPEFVERVAEVYAKA